MSSLSAAETQKQVVVLGAGVIGLTTALRLQESGSYQVEILAEHFPTDPKNINYTSQWAGAHHVSTQEKRPDLEWPTFQEMWKLSESGSLAEHCFMRIIEREYFDSPVRQTDAMQRMSGFQKIPQSDLPAGAQDGYSFGALTIDVPVYLNFLLSRFLEKGGTIVRGRIQHISQVLEAGTHPFKEHGLIRRNEPVTPPHAIVVCLGLGARFLGGVEDQDVYPSRGQTVILRAPWIRSGVGYHGNIAQRWVYVIPRRSGDVVVGGTMGIDDWYPKARSETTRDILEHALLYCPELVPPELRKTECRPKVDELKSTIVEEACGLRPMRKGGPRIELDHLAAGDGRKVPVIFNYGHGSSGYMASIGSAEMCLKLFKEADL